MTWDRQNWVQFFFWTPHQTLLYLVTTISVLLLVMKKASMFQQLWLWNREADHQPAQHLLRCPMRYGWLRERITLSIIPRIMHLPFFVLHVVCYPSSTVSICRHRLIDIFMDVATSIRRVSERHSSEHRLAWYSINHSSFYVVSSMSHVLYWLLCVRYNTVSLVSTACTSSVLISREFNDSCWHKIHRHRPSCPPIYQN